MNRLGLGVIAAGALAGVTADAPLPAQTQARPWMLVYVGAEDCGPCRTWRREQRPAFLASAEFPRLVYREFVAGRLRDLLDGTNWPEDIRPLQAAVKARPGAPQWLIVEDGRVIRSEAGLPAWQAIWPDIRTALRRP
jgi:hypothetical protein